MTKFKIRSRLRRFFSPLLPGFRSKRECRNNPLGASLANAQIDIWVEDHGQVSTCSGSLYEPTITTNVNTAIPSVSGVCGESYDDEDASSRIVPTVSRESFFSPSQCEGPNPRHCTAEGGSGSVNSVSAGDSLPSDTPDLASMASLTTTAAPPARSGDHGGPLPLTLSTTALNGECDADDEPSKCIAITRGHPDNQIADTPNSDVSSLLALPNFVPNNDAKSIVSIRGTNCIIEFMGRLGPPATRPSKPSPRSIITTLEFSTQPSLPKPGRIYAPQVNFAGRIEQWLIMVEAILGDHVDRENSSLPQLETTVTPQVHTPGSYYILTSTPFTRSRLASDIPDQILIRLCRSISQSQLDLLYESARMEVNFYYYANTNPRVALERARAGDVILLALPTQGSGCRREMWFVEVCAKWEWHGFTESGGMVKSNEGDAQSLRAENGHESDSDASTISSEPKASVELNIQRRVEQGRLVENLNTSLDSKWDAIGRTTVRDTSLFSTAPPDADLPSYEDAVEHESRPPLGYYGEARPAGPWAWQWQPVEQRFIQSPEPEDCRRRFTVTLRPLSAIGQGRPCPTPPTDCSVEANCGSSSPPSSFDSCSDSSSEWNPETFSELGEVLDDLGYYWDNSAELSKQKTHGGTHCENQVGMIAFPSLPSLPPSPEPEDRPRDELTAFDLLMATERGALPPFSEFASPSAHLAHTLMTYDRHGIPMTTILRERQWPVFFTLEDALMYDARQEQHEDWKRVCREGRLLVRKERVDAWNARVKWRAQVWEDRWQSFWWEQEKRRREMLFDMMFLQPWQPQPTLHDQQLAFVGGGDPSWPGNLHPNYHYNDVEQPESRAHILDLSNTPIPPPFAKDHQPDGCFMCIAQSSGIGNMEGAIRGRGQPIHNDSEHTVIYAPEPLRVF
ncbi:hypothetical protein CC2G_002681 [Coprinopsis cinerea AmutBmut pab1-1]|nr:hypothetical protein CC2G_002681 [Coprinopsis cinerea AmutBmut pab1-1]